MARRRRSKSSDLSLIGTIIVGVTVWKYREWMAYILIGLLVLLASLLFIKLLRSLRTRRQNLVLADIDMMDGLEFERHVAALLKKRGFHNVKLTERYDMGVDITAEKDGQRWGIQVKRHKGPVKAAAVRQVVTALKFYSCDRAMVISNSSYSNVARRLAHSNACVLVDRAGLLKLIG